MQAATHTRKGQTLATAGAVLRQAKADSKPTLEDLLEMLVEQALVVQPRSGNDLSIFMRLLGLATPPDKHLFETYVSGCVLSTLRVRIPAGQSCISSLFNHIHPGL